MLVRAVHRTATPDRPRRLFRQHGLPALTATSVASAVLDDVEAVLYLFARGGPPWIVRERHVHYDALGERISPSSTHNFVRLVDDLRRHASNAAFDARLVHRKGAVYDVDLLAHVIAKTVAAQGTPFR